MYGTAGETDCQVGLCKLFSFR